jgi:hypothetical protein
MDLFRQKASHIIKGNALLLIFTLGLMLRLLGLLDITLAGDNLLHWRIAGDITKGIFPLLGPRASLTGDFNLGPFYYYLLAIPYWIGRGDFRVAVIFFAVLNSLSIPLLYLVSKRWFSKTQSLKVSLLFAVSAYFIQIQSFPWNPFVLPLFIIVSLYFINKIDKKHYYNFIFACISYGICLQLHATALFLLPVFIYLLPVKKIPLKYYLSGIGMLLIANFPWILANLSANFSQVKVAFLILSQGRTEQCSFSGWLGNHGNGERCFWYLRNTLFAGRFLAVSVFGFNSIPLALLSLLAVAAYFIKTKFKEHRYLLVWLLVPVVLFLFYTNSIYLHYFIILTPVPFFLLMVFLEKLEKKKIKWILAANLLYLLVIVVNLCQYVWSLQFVRG